MTDNLTTIEGGKDLAEVKTVSEAKEYASQAVSFKDHFRRAKNQSGVARAIELQLQAERRAGEIIRSYGERRGGDQTSSRGSLPSNRELGVTDKESSRFQALAGMNDSDFADHVTDRQNAAIAAMYRQKRRPKAKWVDAEDIGEEQPSDEAEAVHPHEVLERSSTWESIYALT